VAKFELLIGADAFWRRLEQDIGQAQRRVLVQAMTFEGDRVGRDLAAAIVNSRAADRRVLVDRFTKFVVSDRFVYSPWGLLDAALRAEVRDTGRMFAEMVSAGVGVRWTNPAGAFLWRFAARNHKKLMVVDDAAYLGGINFSEHNFSWLDLMVRIEDPAAVDFLAADFDATYAGHPVAGSADGEDCSVLSLDGVGNAQAYGSLIERLGGARESILVVSPYITFPFMKPLGAARARGVPVTLIVPQQNNKKTVERYLRWEAGRQNIELLRTPGMHHMKAIVIDGEELIVGSSNFDLVSYHAHEEFMLSIRHQATVDRFTAAIGPRAAAAVSAAGSRRPARLAGPLSYLLLKIVAGFARLGGLARRHSVDFDAG